MPWLIALALLVVPIAEIYVIIQVGQVIGGWPTVGLLLVESALGAWIVKREGRRAWNALQTALQTGKMPGRELTDGALVLIGGTLLLTPGFLTDILGFFFVLPFTRPLARRAVTSYFSRRAARLTPTTLNPFIPGATPPPRNDDVIQGEVIDPEK
ncbi:FxsA family protein [Kribbella sp. NPDC026611]|uniref:FxsA family protein n=1 Tax=Kribbella sp. NPDC026611 TaxID=3154911 RepID=UPI0033D50C00